MGNLICFASMICFQVYFITRPFWIRKTQVQKERLFFIKRFHVLLSIQLKINDCKIEMSCISLGICMSFILMGRQAYQWKREVERFWLTTRSIDLFTNNLFFCFDNGTFQQYVLEILLTKVMKQSTALCVIPLICVLYCIVYIAICNKYLIIRWLIIMCILSLILTQLVGDAIQYPIFFSTTVLAPL